MTIGKDWLHSMAKGEVGASFKPHQKVGLHNTHK